MVYCWNTQLTTEPEGAQEVTVNEANASLQEGNFLTRLPRRIADFFVVKPLRALDRGEVFQIFYTFLMRLAAVLMLVVGPLWMIYYFFNDRGWWARLDGEPNFLILRSVVALPLSGFVAIATILVVAGILWTRASDMRGEKYRGLIGIFLRLIKVTGEVYSVFPISTALTMFFSSLFAARPFAPLTPGIGAFTSLLAEMTGFLRPLASLANRGQGTYGAEITLGSWFASVGGSLLGLVLSVFVAVTILAFFYLVAEVFGLIYYFLMRKPMFEEGK
jgi:hypothetical protein